MFITLSRENLERLGFRVRKVRHDPKSQKTLFEVEPQGAEGPVLSEKFVDYLRSTIGEAPMEIFAENTYTQGMAEVLKTSLTVSQYNPEEKSKIA